MSAVGREVGAVVPGGHAHRGAIDKGLALQIRVEAAVGSELSALRAFRQRLTIHEPPVRIMVEVVDPPSVGTQPGVEGTGFDYHVSVDHESEAFRTTEALPIQGGVV